MKTILRGSNTEVDVQPIKSPKSRVELYALIRVCPGGRHAWFRSSCGDVRKPIKQVKPA